MPDVYPKVEQRRESIREETASATVKQAKERNHKRTVKDNEPENTC